MPNKSIVRDHIAIDTTFYNSVLAKDVNPKETITVIARLVELLAPIELSGRNIDIVATTFLGNSHLIANTGYSGSIGSTGPNGPSAAPGRIGGRGEDGLSGGIGTGGGDSGAVRILAEYANGVNIQSHGGVGGQGGVGGNGGAGSSVTLDLTHADPESISQRVEDTLGAMAGTGGRGGQGGQGGPGGMGGVISLKTVTIGSTPSLDVEGGLGGPAGSGDSYDGLDGYLTLDYRGPPLQDPPWVPPPLPAQKSGRVGPPGSPGSRGSIDQNLGISLTEYWSMVAQNSLAVSWAEHRLAVAKYLFRCYVPGISGRSDCLQRSVTECQAVLSICDNLGQDVIVAAIAKEANRIIDNIWAGNNPLSLPFDFDVAPDFEAAIANFDSTFLVIDTFFTKGLTLLLEGIRRGDVGGQLETQKISSSIRKEIKVKEAESLGEEKKGQEEDLVRMKKLIVEVNQQIEAAKEEMKRKPMTFEQISGLVIDVGAVIAAIPSGGASLIALAPVAISLGKEVLANIPELAKAIFSDEKEGEGTKLMKDIEGKYEATKKDRKEVQEAGKAVVDLVKTIKKLKESRTPDKSKLVNLLEKAAELLHQRMLLERQITISGMRIDAANEIAGKEGDLIKGYESMIATNSAEENIVRKCGLDAVHSVQSQLDTLLRSAFYASRALEIYILLPQSQNIFYDAGHIHPDVEKNYTEQLISDTQLVDSYVRSWLLLIKPQGMKDDWYRYFERNIPEIGIHRYNFDDVDLLQSFRETLVLNFRIDRQTLPADRYFTKAQGVYVSFRGATSTGNIFDYTVTHGPIYTQYTSDSVSNDLLAKPLSSDWQAGKDDLTIKPVDTTDNEKITNPQRLAFWTRGVMGDFTIEVPRFELDSQNANFSGLFMIQVWIAYQYVH